MKQLEKPSSYIGKFEVLVKNLCNPYEHPIYLSTILGLSEDSVQSFLQKILTQQVALSQPKESRQGAEQLGVLSQHSTSDVSSKQEVVQEKEKEWENSLSQDIKKKIEELGKDTLTRRQIEEAIDGVLEEALGKYKTSSEAQKSISWLKESSKDWLDKYLEELIRGAIRRDLASQKLEDDNRYRKLEQIIRELWVIFAESLLRGEFLEEPEYSVILGRIVKYISDTYTGFSSEELVYLHPVLPKIHALCQELSYMCQRIRIQISEDAKKRRVFHAPVSQAFNRPYIGGLDAEEIQHANLFYEFGQRLIEVTRVDVMGVIDAETISSLFLFDKQCCLLLEDQDEGEAKPINFPWDTAVRRVFQRIRAKVSLLLFQSFYKPQLDDISKTIDKGKSIGEPYHRAKSFEVLYEGKRYNVVSKSESSLDSLCDVLACFENLTPCTYEATPSSDVEAYNRYIGRGGAIKGDVPKSPDDLLEQLLGKANKPEGDLQSCEDLPLDILLAMMKKLSERRKEEKGNSDSFARAMEELLKGFSSRIQTYKDFVAADQKSRSYGDSFFSLGSDSDVSKETGVKDEFSADIDRGRQASMSVCQEKEEVIFISSYGCKLVNTQSLEREAYPRYNRLYRQWLSEAQTEALKAAEKAKEEAQSVMKEAQRVMEEVPKMVGETKEKVNEKLNEKLNEFVQGARQESISILSVFAALTAFISGSIMILKGSDTLADYLILAGTLYIFILSIISFLYFRKIEGEKSFDWIKNLVLFVSILLAFVAIGFGFYTKIGLGQKEEIEIKHESTFRQVIPRPTSVPSEKQLESSSAQKDLISQPSSASIPAMR